MWPATRVLEASGVAKVQQFCFKPLFLYISEKNEKNEGHLVNTNGRNEEKRRKKIRMK